MRREGNGHRERLEAELRSRVDGEGYAVLAVFDPDEEVPPLTYTLGVWRGLRVPEVIAVGVDHELGAALVEEYVRRCRDGERFEPGRCYEGFLEGLPVTFEWVSAEHHREWLGSASVVYPDGGFRMLQLLVPDPDGVWPWQPGAPHELVRGQPVLTASGRPESWDPEGTGP
ncbi:DUF4262 domain-containing protein [Streptoalloteichus hindustanus]|uniref:DUF4262 domain-containing protein n=1 Tax=Streptoalloteichus hindustanus TaxID=2017 RepID=A0A1M5HAG2_STRHI|nr:DUF4262 domain-containing protein [Streptoalloteichus hindustanus]SHG12937.1 protein of unknown function [Streptoalloteichus hindustanus]